MAIMAMRKNVIPQAPMHKGIVCPTKPTLVGTQFAQILIYCPALIGAAHLNCRAGGWTKNNYF